MGTPDYERSYALYQDGRSAWERGEGAEAIDLLRRSTEAALHFKTLELLGEYLLEKGDALAAAVHFGAAAALATDSSRPRFLLGRALAELGHVDAAREQLHRAIEQRPQFKAARELLAALPAADKEAKLAEGTRS